MRTAADHVSLAGGTPPARCGVEPVAVIADLPADGRGGRRLLRFRQGGAPSSLRGEAFAFAADAIGVEELTIGRQAGANGPADGPSRPTEEAEARVEGPVGRPLLRTVSLLAGVIVSEAKLA